VFVRQSADERQVTAGRKQAGCDRSNAGRTMADRPAKDSNVLSSALLSTAELRSGRTELGLKRCCCCVVGGGRAADAAAAAAAAFGAGRDVWPRPWLCGMPCCTALTITDRELQRRAAGASLPLPSP
jgi:hypothetical protein